MPTNIEFENTPGYKWVRDERVQVGEIVTTVGTRYEKRDNKTQCNIDGQPPGVDY